MQCVCYRMWILNMCSRMHKGRESASKAQMFVINAARHAISPNQHSLYRSDLRTLTFT